MLTIIDARSGKTVKVGETITYPPTLMLDGSKKRSAFKLEAFVPGLFTGRAQTRIYDGDRELIATYNVRIRGILNRTAILPT